MLGTGQRPSAAVAMRHDQFQGEWMTVTDEKGNETLDVYCPLPLRKFIETLPVEGEHLQPKSPTEPLTYHAVEKTFSAWRTSLGPTALAISCARPRFETRVEPCADRKICRAQRVSICAWVVSYGYRKCVFGYRKSALIALNLA